MGNVKHKTLLEKGYTMSCDEPGHGKTIDTHLDDYNFTFLWDEPIHNNNIDTNASDSWANG